MPVYVDLSDPLEYIEAACDMASAAAAAGTAAAVCAGAFPGLSNVLAVDLARKLPAPPADIKFSYFTAGAAKLDLSSEPGVVQARVMHAC